MLHQYITLIVFFITMYNFLYKTLIVRCFKIKLQSPKITFLFGHANIPFISSHNKHTKDLDLAYCMRIKLLNLNLDFASKIH